MSRGGGRHRRPAPAATTDDGFQQDVTAAVYCPSSDTIAYDGDWVRQVSAEDGDAFVHLVLAHEYGHAVGIRLLTTKLGITEELHADCYAGAALGGAVDAGGLALEEGDEAEFDAAMQRVGDEDDSWFLPGAHGTPDQRSAAFWHGWDGGPVSCL